jgi:hypothetical protein
MTFSLPLDILPYSLRNLTSISERPHPPHPVVTHHSNWCVHDRLTLTSGWFPLLSVSESDIKNSTMDVPDEDRLFEELTWALLDYIHRRENRNRDDRTQYFINPFHFDAALGNHFTLVLLPASITYVGKPLTC